jgi:DNA primase catalytic subunit
MAKHKKPPIRNKEMVVPVKLSAFHKAAQEAVEQATWLIETALREEFGFGEARIQRLRDKVDELARHKSFEAWVDYTIRQKMG